MHVRTLIAALILVLGVLSSGDAIAQIAVMRDGELPNGDIDPTNVLFGARDCREGVTVKHVVSGVVASDTVQIWVADGADCKDATNRSGANQACYQLPTTLTNNVTYDFQLSASAIAGAGIAGLTACADTGTVERSLTLYFLVNPNTGGVTDNAAEIPVGIDFVGPNAPTITSVGANNATSVEVEFDEAAGSIAETFVVYCEQAGVQVIPGTGGAGGTSAATTAATTAGAGGGASSQGFKPLGGVGGSGGGVAGAGGAGGAGGALGGAGGTAGAGGSATGGAGAATGAGGAASGAGGTSSSGAGGSSTTTPSDEDCEDPQVLVSGQIADAAAVACTADANNTGSPVLATVTEGFNYWIAVAAVDALGNEGPLSNLECSGSSDVDDFWSEYLANGGQAGGGCGCSTVGIAPTHLGWAGWVLACLVLGARRRREVA